MHASEGKLTRIKYTLDELAEEVNQGRLEPPILKDFKLTVDQLRMSLWAVIALEGTSPSPGSGANFGLATKLGEFRVKRLLVMLNELCADLEGNRIPRLNPDLPALLSSLAKALEGVMKLVQPAQSAQ